MKKIALLLAIFPLATFMILARDTQFYMPHPDGAYDNYNILVDPAEMGIERMKKSVVRVISAAVLKSNERVDFSYSDIRSVGGMVIAGKYILSAAHVVAPDDKAEIETPFGILTEAAHKISEVFVATGTPERPSAQLKLVYINREIDVAVFELPTSVSIPSFPYSLGKSRDLKVGNYVYILGYPLGLGVNVRDGIVNALRMPDTWNADIEQRSRDDFFMVSVGVTPNDSGTAIIAIRDGRYELVGIASSMAIYNNLGMAIRIDAVREAIAEDCAACSDDLKQFFDTGNISKE